MLRIELDSVRKQRNKSEWRMIGRARCMIPGTRTLLESRGDGENLRLLCRSLVDHGVTGLAEVYRGKTPIFAAPIDIERMASFKFGKGQQPKHLKQKSGAENEF